jgi:hypothetical protein
MLEENGVELTVDRTFFDRRRRVKNEAELGGIRRAQRAAEAGMDAARDLFRRAQPSNGSLVVEGAPLTSERVKLAIQEAFTRHGCSSEEFIVSHGAQSAIGHEMGSGEIRAGEPIVIDLWPKDAETACFADMTRTFCIGEIPGELRAFHRVVKESLDRSLASVRAGARGPDVFAVSCEPFHREGHKTLLNKEPGEIIEDGYFHSLGHGVGLDVHEQPSLARSGEDLARGRRRHARAGPLPPRLGRLPARGSRARHRGRRREPHGLPVRPRAIVAEPAVAGDRHAAPRGAALPAARRLRGAGERAAGDLRPRPGRVLGYGGARARDVVRDFHTVCEWEPPYAKWFVGGKLNITYNCVDRHVEAGNGAQGRLLLGGRAEGDRRDVTFAISCARRRSSRTRSSRSA